MRRKPATTTIFTGKIPIGTREVTVHVTCTLDLPPDLTDEEKAALARFSLADGLATMKPQNNARAEAILASMKRGVTTVSDYLPKDDK
jgi:hypothetical protein